MDDCYINTSDMVLVAKNENKFLFIKPIAVEGVETYKLTFSEEGLEAAKFEKIYDTEQDALVAARVICKLYDLGIVKDRGNYFKTM